MPPTLELEYGSFGEAFFGLGLERFGFSDTPPEARQWWKSVKSPESILEQLQAAPDSALVILRSAATISLLKQQSLTIGSGNKYQNTEVNWLMNQAFPLTTAAVGSIYPESRDAGATTNHVIPLTTDKGVLEIVLNPAWGIAWRLSPSQLENTPFAAAVAQYPQLAVTLPEDLSQPPKTEGFHWKPRYLPPRLLSEISQKRVDFPKTAADLRQLLADLLADQETAFSGGSVLSGNNLLLPDDGFSYFSIENSSQKTEVQFWLGKEYGSKFVDISDYRSLKEDKLSPLAQQAIEISRILKPLHHLLDSH